MRFRIPSLVGLCGLIPAIVGAQAPALKTAPLPAIPANVQVGGEVILELGVDPGGIVAESRVLRDTPPFTESVRGAVAEWRFEPASSPRLETVAVLLAAVFRPPTLRDSVGGAGTPPRDVDVASPTVPFPTLLRLPAYPARASESGRVLVEVAVDVDGNVGDTRTVEGDAGYVRSALDAVCQWKFLPALRDGVAVPSKALVFFGFPAPAL